MEEEIEKMKEKFRGISKVPKAQINSLIIACILGGQQTKRVKGYTVKVTKSMQENIETAAAILLAEAEEMENEVL